MEALENFMLGEFDCAVIYEALHHVDYPENVLDTVDARLG
jgi:2-polyprenyl-3-methyl-5-hydroxy-6-metoxy-1,4-benzoquinol methylase